MSWLFISANQILAQPVLSIQRVTVYFHFYSALICLSRTFKLNLQWSNCVICPQVIPVNSPDTLLQETPIQLHSSTPPSGSSVLRLHITPHHLHIFTSVSAPFGDSFPLARWDSPHFSFKECLLTEMVNGLILCCHFTMYFTMPLIQPDIHIGDAVTQSLDILEFSVLLKDT